MNVSKVSVAWVMQDDHGPQNTRRVVMKKLLGVSLLTLAVALLAQQEASAWSNIRFGIGLNMAWQTGNNSFGWGLWRDGQVPGSPTDAGLMNRGGSGYGGGGGYGGGHGGGGGNAPPPPGFGFGGQDFFGPNPNPNQGPMKDTPEPPAAPKSEKADGPEQVGYYYNSYVRPAVYTTPSYAPYYVPGYNYNYYFTPQAYYYGQ
jgi:hypothetical protein